MSKYVCAVISDGNRSFDNLLERYCSNDEFYFVDGKNPDGAWFWYRLGEADDQYESTSEYRTKRAAFITLYGTDTIFDKEANRFWNKRKVSDIEFELSPHKFDDDLANDWDNVVRGKPSRSLHTIKDRTGKILNGYEVYNRYLTKEIFIEQNNFAYPDAFIDPEGMMWKNNDKTYYDTRNYIALWKYTLEDCKDCYITFAVLEKED